MFEETSYYENESHELDIVKHSIDTEVNEKRTRDAFKNKGKQHLVMKLNLVSIFIGKSKWSNQTIVKESGTGSSLSIEARLEFLKHQEVLRGRTFDPALINTLEMIELLEMMKSQN